MVKIYTKRGDKGMTSLASGTRVGKDCPRICAFGEVDGLNAALGVCRQAAGGYGHAGDAGGGNSCAHAQILEDDKYFCDILKRIQNDLFVLGADLAMPMNMRTRTVKIKGLRIGAADVKKLENWIDEIEAQLTRLRNFILPGGCESAAFLHLARTVCRRAERTVASLQKREKINPEVVKYLNRLGDLLFVMARYANKKEDVEEEKWEILV